MVGFCYGPALALFLLLCMTVRDTRTRSALEVALRSTIQVTLDSGPAVGITNRRVLLGGRTHQRTCTNLFPRTDLINDCSQTVGGRSFTVVKRIVRINASGACDNNLSIDLPIFTPTLCGDVDLADASIGLTMRGSHTSHLSVMGRIAGTFFRLLLTRSDCRILLGDCGRDRSGCGIIGTGCRRKAIDRCSGVDTSIRVHDLGPAIISTHGKIGLTGLRLGILVKVRSSMGMTIRNGLGSCRVSVFAHRTVPHPSGLAGGDALGRLRLGTLRLGRALGLRCAGFVPALSTDFRCVCASVGSGFGFGRCS